MLMRSRRVAKGHRRTIAGPEKRSPAARRSAGVEFRVARTRDRRVARSRAAEPTYRGSQGFGTDGRTGRDDGEVRQGRHFPYSFTPTKKMISVSFELFSLSRKPDWKQHISQQENTFFCQVPAGRVIYHCSNRIIHFQATLVPIKYEQFT